MQEQENQKTESTETTETVTEKPATTFGDVTKAVTEDPTTTVTEKSTTEEHVEGRRVESDDNSTN